MDCFNQHWDEKRAFWRTEEENAQFAGGACPSRF
jgi:hypothetical protein